MSRRARRATDRTYRCSERIVRAGCERRQLPAKRAPGLVARLAQSRRHSRAVECFSPSSGRNALHVNGGSPHASRAKVAMARRRRTLPRREGECAMTVKATDLAELYPLDKLREENLEQLAREAVSEEVGRGSVLFQAGATDEQTIFLRSGRVRGTYPDGRKKDIDASTLQGRYAVGDLQPRRFTATVISLAATVIKIDRRYLEMIQTWDQLSHAENFRYYDPSPDANRWVFRLLQSRALHKLPTGNIERMFQRFEEIAVRTGDVVIREGDPADYYYVIKDGAASVTKKLDTGSSVVAYLVRGDTFGEDALLSNTTRNATVTMIKDGGLMRLSKKEFEEVMKPPVVV